jgi:hypothetical protein
MTKRPAWSFMKTPRRDEVHQLAEGGDIADPPQELLLKL